MTASGAEPWGVVDFVPDLSPLPVAEDAEDVSPAGSFATVTLELSPGPDLTALVAFIGAVLLMPGVRDTSVADGPGGSVVFTIETDHAGQVVLQLLRIETPRVLSLTTTEDGRLTARLEPLEPEPPPEPVPARIDTDPSMYDPERLVQSASAFGSTLGATVDALRAALATLAQAMPEESPREDSPATDVSAEQPLPESPSLGDESEDVAPAATEGLDADTSERPSANDGQSSDDQVNTARADSGSGSTGIISREDGLPVADVHDSTRDAADSQRVDDSSNDDAGSDGQDKATNNAAPKTDPEPGASAPEHERPTPVHTPPVHDLGVTVVSMRRTDGPSGHDGRWWIPVTAVVVMISLVAGIVLSIALLGNGGAGSITATSVARVPGTSATVAPSPVRGPGAAEVTMSAPPSPEPVTPEPVATQPPTLVWATVVTPAGATVNVIRYPAKAGELVEAIARYFGALPEELAALNGLTPTGVVPADQEVLVPQP
ncbi:MAG: hypothetical protein HYX51_11765 [Chloroflexi bacterium]|nr:hypothetical protein [Chloroflexota bacterium]